MTDTPTARAVRASLRALRQTAGVFVQYNPDGGTGFTLPAVRARTAIAAEIGLGIVIETARNRDYLVDSDDLNGHTPTPADTITDDDGTWALTSIGDGRVYEPMDPDSVGVRLHTKQIAE